jgi:hypothetical protein
MGIDFDDRRPTTDSEDEPRCTSGGFLEQDRVEEADRQRALEERG